MTCCNIAVTMDLHPIVAFLIKKKKCSFSLCFPYKVWQAKLVAVKCFNCKLCLFLHSSLQILILFFLPSILHLVSKSWPPSEIILRGPCCGITLVTILWILKFISDVSVRLQAMWRNLGLLWDLSEARGQWRGMLRVSAVPTVLPVPEMKVWVAFHGITLHRGTISCDVLTWQSLSVTTFAFGFGCMVSTAP